MAGLLLLAADHKAVPAEDAAADPASKLKVGRLIRVPLPITGNADTQVIAAARKAMAEMPVGDDRGVLVLEFSSNDKHSGEGSDFERSLKLARFLSSREASAVETVAYIPEALKGHAVLAAMACEEHHHGPRCRDRRSGPRRTGRSN